MFQLPQQNGVAEMQVGCSGIETRLDAQGSSAGSGLLQLRAEFGAADDLGGTLFYVGELLVDRREVEHR